MTIKTRLFFGIVFCLTPSVIFPAPGEAAKDSKVIQEAARAGDIWESYVKAQNGRKNSHEVYLRLAEDAKDGSHEAQYLVGMSLLNGIGVDKDVLDARFWLKKSALQGFTPAQLALAGLYESDEYFIDNSEAYAWYLVASINGKEQATAKTLELQTKLTPEELEQAKERGIKYQSEVAKLGNDIPTGKTAVSAGPLPQSAGHEASAASDDNEHNIYSLYLELLKKRPSAKGKIIFSLTIAPEGTVSKWEIVQDEIKDPAFSIALANIIKRFEFKRSSKPTEILYPIDFVPD